MTQVGVLLEIWRDSPARARASLERTLRALPASGGAELIEYLLQPSSVLLLEPPTLSAVPDAVVAERGVRGTGGTSGADASAAASATAAEATTAANDSLHDANVAAYGSIEERHRAR